jgi:hypothetical protein
MCTQYRATAACQEREHHGIAGRDFENISTYALDDSCAFVAKHDWLWHRVALVTCNHLCVAQAGGHDLDQYFIAPRPSKLNVSMLKGPPFSRATAALICVVFLLIDLSSSVETL